MTRRRRKELRRKKAAQPAKPKFVRSSKAKGREAPLDQRFVNYLAEEHPEF